jgi:hypothetical protein
VLSEAATDGTAERVEKRLEVRFEASFKARQYPRARDLLREGPKGKPGGCGRDVDAPGSGGVGLTLGAMMGLVDSKDRTMAAEGMTGRVELKYQRPGPNGQKRVAWPKSEPPRGEAVISGTKARAVCFTMRLR